MKDYLLFIDTEASGLPKNWCLPYTAPCNWPYAAQISWLIYAKDGKKIKEQNYYVNNNDFEICATALRIHGLTKKFLLQNGIPRHQILNLLAKDLQQYQPMIVGHFIELDYHVIGAECCRAGMDHILLNLPAFCTMIASTHLQQNLSCKYLRLGVLYELLFKQPLLHQHNALVDATATADCFFELVKRNEIKSFVQPPIEFQKKEKISGMFGWVIALLLVLLSALLIIFYYG